MTIQASNLELWCKSYQESKKSTKWRSKCQNCGAHKPHSQFLWARPWTNTMWHTANGQRNTKQQACSPPKAKHKGILVIYSPQKSIFATGSFIIRAEWDTCCDSCGSCCGLCHALGKRSSHWNLGSFFGRKRQQIGGGGSSVTYPTPPSELKAERPRSVPRQKIQIEGVQFCLFSPPMKVTRAPRGFRCKKQQNWWGG